MTLFDDFHRTDDTRMRHAESSFAFLNRSSWPVCERDRRLYQKWLDGMPHEAQSGLVGRFTSEDDDHHVAAAFELLIHAIMTQLGATVSVEPSIPGSTTTPDFLVEHRDTQFYIEATVSRALSTGGQRDQLEATVFDWINSIESPNFRLDVNTTGKLVRLPKRAAVIEPLRDLLTSHDPDQLRLELVRSGGRWPVPSVTVPYDDWELTAELIPKAFEDRGRNNDSTIGVYPTEDYVGVHEALVRKIAGKAKAKHGRKLSSPLIIAVNTSDGFFDVKHDAVQVLLGDTLPRHEVAQHTVDRHRPRADDAVWISKSGRPQHEYVHGVWMFVGATPGNPSPAGHDSCLYLNPFIDADLPPLLRRVPRAEAPNGIMEWHEGESLDRLLGIPEIPWDQLRRLPGG